MTTSSRIRQCSEGESQRERRADPFEGTRHACLRSNAPARPYAARGSAAAARPRARSPPCSAGCRAECERARCGTSRTLPVAVTGARSSRGARRSTGRSTSRRIRAASRGVRLRGARGGAVGRAVRWLDHSGSRCCAESATSSPRGTRGPHARPSTAHGDAGPSASQHAAPPHHRGDRRAPHRLALDRRGDPPRTPQGTLARDRHHGALTRGANWTG